MWIGGAAQVILLSVVLGFSMHDPLIAAHSCRGQAGGEGETERGDHPAVVRRGDHQHDRHETGAHPAGQVHDGLARKRKTSQRRRTQHEVEITKAFWLGLHEVTQKQFKEVMGYNPSYFSKDGEGKNGVQYRWSKPAGGKDKVPADTSNFPVENVS